MKRTLLFSVLLVCLMLLTGSLMPSADAAEPASPIATLKNFNLTGLRSVKMMASSTKEKRNTVRVLFYGQSITAQWSWPLERYLLETYPYTNFKISRKAIGGFTADRLVKTAPMDINAFYPDLMVFHDYTNDPVPYEEIIRQTLEYTTADIIISNDHVTRPEQLTEETDPTLVKQDEYIPWQNYFFLPDLARRYDIGFINVRDSWKQHLRENNLEPKQLLRDTVHLNEPGISLMVELMQAGMTPEDAAGPAKQNLQVKDYLVGQDVEWKDNRLELEFEGNRVDLVAISDALPEGTCEVLIDGKKPVELSGTVAFGRANSYPGSWWPGVMRVTSHSPPVVEEWSARLFEANDDLTEFKFEVTGSFTRLDGIGSNMETFVSESGRVVIDPDDWHLARAFAMKKRPMPEGFTLKWKAMPLYINTYEAPKIMTPVIETVTTVAQGFNNGKHLLTLVVPEGATPPPVQTVRVYHPMQLR